jgi:hypothetical protein
MVFAGVFGKAKSVQTSEGHALAANIRNPRPPGNFFIPSME